MNGAEEQVLRIIELAPTFEEAAKRIVAELDRYDHRCTCGHHKHDHEYSTMSCRESVGMDRCDCPFFLSETACL